MRSIQPLKSIATILVSNVDKKTADDEVGVRLCNYVDVYYNDRITNSLSFMEATASAGQIAMFGLRQGDVLFTKDSETPDDIAVPAYVPADLPGVVCGYHLAIARPRSGAVDGRFLYWALSSQAIREQFAVAATGVTRFGLRQDEIRSVKVPVPDLNTQRTIANYLDAETNRIDAIIKKKLEFSRLLDKKIDSLIYELVGAIPTRRRLRHLAKLGTGHTPDRRNSEYWENCVVPWVTAEDLSSRDNPFELLMDTRQKISALGVANSAAVIHPSGTVMLCRTASIGLICRIGIPMATTQAFVTWSPGPELNSGFLMYALHSLRQEWMRLAFGSTHDTIYMPDLESVKIPYVPIAEQIMISRKLDTSTSRLLEAKELLNRQCKTLKERRQALITAAVTGEIEIPEAAA